ncbi:hypothetical protein HYPBUDRAFT_107239 [Hyphopichia burtonii NRRL Y-1933]|uniref:Nucleolar complex-associated protein 3 n=1 Tax=Hyphopichia burtonii NRRL Y-1933 TaxID=984485 RepID=A0A1E4RKJ0_9ASCO|nr:hypothetical protein HYPBUDRAFT_107239 [Hyphopichia burtonii NRRL Y-1933]ODV67721.1 hypothetical protein HYPBUDRAFT_107239 [Hyphopichia burtonii NRRL Y-1933]
MAKRKNNKELEAKRKKAKQEQDSLLSAGVFSTHDQNESEEDIKDWDNEEQDYELRPRSINNEKKMVEGLPIKTSDGRIERVVREVNEGEPEEEPEEEPEQEEEAEKEEEPEEDEDSHLSPQEKLTKLKEEIANLASKLIEDPEENISCLTRLRKMSESNNVVTCQLAIMALIPVFKSLAPGYRIRPLTDAEKREKVSKEVARLRQFEQILIHNYKQYIDHLTKLSKISNSNSQNNKKITPNQIKLGQLSSKAACELCSSSLRHFNYRAELFNIIIRRLNKKPNDNIDYEIFTKCIQILQTTLIDDEQHGDITYDIVKLLSKSIKDKKFRVDESVINIFLSLSLLHDYDPNNNKDDQDKKPKLKKKDRVHLSKKERKARKERKEIDEEMRKAEQAVTAEEREKFQAQVLKMVLTLYLEILKAGSHTVNNSTGSSGKNDATLLMAAVLEGLSRFGQMANFDLLGDFLEVLREIMSDILDEHSLANTSIFDTNDNDDEDDYGGMYTGQQIRTVLLCIATSFALILNHSTTGKLPMSIDLTRFINSLYVILADLSLDTDLELSHKSLRLADPLSPSNSTNKPSVNVSTKAELLLRCLDCIFFRSRNGTLPRATSFTKRLYILTLNSPEKTALANLKFVGKLMSRYGEGFKGLWNTEERISGEGSYTLGIERPNVEVELERCNSGAATLWENVLLDKHYSPMVKDGSRSLMKSSKPSN